MREHVLSSIVVQCCFRWSRNFGVWSFNSRFCFTTDAYWVLSQLWLHGDHPVCELIGSHGLAKDLIFFLLAISSTCVVLSVTRERLVGEHLWGARRVYFAS